jgi:prepilin-type N-terminal cleavage/methylation domain-containing protein
MKYFNLKNNKGPARTCLRGGFTLVEMMVAIAVFSIVMVTAMSALLNVIDANNKARSLKTAINNVSFALEGISKDMRMGKEYNCSGESDTLNFVGNCTGGGEAIRFKSSKENNPYLFYRFVEDEGKGRIEACSDQTDTCSEYSAITSPEVDLNRVTFYILNVGEIGKQPRMLMTVSGEAGTKEKIKTQFDLQTGVSQIVRPE